MFKLFNLAALLLLAATCLNAQTENEKAPYALLEEAMLAFESRDINRFAAVFTENADFITPNGFLLHGREAIRAAQAQVNQA